VAARNAEMLMRQNAAVGTKVMALIDSASWRAKAAQ
jgi:hypothetical protein